MTPGARVARVLLVVVAATFVVCGVWVGARAVGSVLWSGK